MAVAFSGGVDSACLLSLAGKMCKERVTAVLMDSVFLANDERKWAVSLAEEMNVELHTLKWDPLNVSMIRKNGKRRCYHCKLQMYNILRKYVSNKNIKNILDGTHTDDLRKERPGYRAILELGIHTPFLNAGLNKAEIRLLAKDLLPLHAACRAAQSCLATRIKTDQEIDAETLGVIEKIEGTFKKNGYWHVRCKIADDRATIYTGEGGKYDARICCNI